MKHAYLIIAHNEFVVLQTLLDLLDDERNRLFVHIDKKVKALPELHTEKAGLTLLDKRIDVRWGDVSQVEVELLLMQEAIGCGADYFHIISGTTLPLKALDEIDEYFADRAPAYFAPMETNDAELDLKMRRYNFNTRRFIRNNKKWQAFNQMLWHIMIAAQKALRIRRNTEYGFVKASNWCSLSFESVTRLLSNKSFILKKYRLTLCPDEFFIPSELESFSIKDDYLFTDFVGANPKSFSLDQLDTLKSTPYLWARKFSASII